MINVNTIIYNVLAQPVNHQGGRIDIRCFFQELTNCNLCRLKLVIGIYIHHVADLSNALYL